jgi:agmatinase
MMLTDGEHPSFGVDLTKHVADLGDADITTGNVLKMLGQVEHVASNVLNWDKHPVFLGGDHSITLGILRAVNKMYGKVAVVHFDAHCDTWSNNFDEPIGHGTWLYNAIKEGIVDPAKVFSIGIRSPADAESRSFLEDHGGTTFTARYAQSNMQSVINSILGTIENTPVYLSFDIDCLDPAHAPGTGTPEIGGLTSMWVLECLESLFGLNWVGMDMVEISPPYDHSSITSLAAATICWTYLSMIIAKSLDTSDVFDCGDTADDTDFRNIEEDTASIGPTGPS